jgi:hypothetical protein
LPDCAAFTVPFAKSRSIAALICPDVRAALIE